MLSSVSSSAGLGGTGPPVITLSPGNLVGVIAEVRSASPAKTLLAPTSFGMPIKRCRLGRRKSRSTIMQFFLSLLTLSAAARQDEDLPSPACVLTKAIDLGRPLPEDSDKDERTLLYASDPSDLGSASSSSRFSSSRQKGIAPSTGSPSRYFTSSGEIIFENNCSRARTVAPESDAPRNRASARFSGNFGHVGSGGVDALSTTETLLACNPDSALS